MRLVQQSDERGYRLLAAMPVALWERLEGTDIMPIQQGRIAGESGTTAAACPYAAGGARRRWRIGHRAGRKIRAARNPLDQVYSLDEATIARTALEISSDIMRIRAHQKTASGADGVDRFGRPRFRDNRRIAFAWLQQMADVCTGERYSRPTLRRLTRRVQPRVLEIIHAPAAAPKRGATATPR